jgi:hypothetical protein
MLALIVAAQFSCVPGVRFAVRVEGGTLECAKDAKTPGCAKVCDPRAKAMAAWHGKGEAIDPGCSPRSEWCVKACDALAGCVWKSGAPAKLTSEARCRTDADCSVSNGRSCCGCKTIEVHSRVRRRATLIRSPR